MNKDELGKLMVGETFDNVPVNTALWNMTINLLKRDCRGEEDVEFYSTMNKLAAEGHERAARDLRKIG